MNNLTFSVNKVTGLSVRFLSVFFCLFVVCATAEAGNTFKYNYSVTVAPQTSNPGRGKVYMDAKAAFLYEDKTKWADLSDSKNTELYNANQTLTVSVSKDNEDKTNQKSPWIEYTSVTLKAEALAGSKFTKWSWTENSEEKSSTAVTISIPCPEIHQMNPNNKDDTDSESCPITYTAHFTPRTYYYKMPGADANEGGKVYISTTAGRPAEDSGDWQTKIAAGTTALSQTADDNGRYAKATIKIYCYAQSPGDDYEFVGWFAATGSVMSTSLDYEYVFEAKSEKSNSPTTNTLHAVFRPKNNVTRITKDNVETIELYTGTELFVEGDATYGKFPYYPKTKVDLSSTFAANGTPLFDRLYVFGFTTSPEALVYEGVNGHKITKAGGAAGSNAITPCYIYEKTVDGYALVQTVPNMNMSDKDSKFNITADGKKYYFTGYCPFATTGYSSAYGVVSVTGSANQTIDIYLHDLCIFARTHTRLGNASNSDENDLIKVNINLSGVNYPAASAAVFAFQTSNKDTSTPFQPTIHLLGKNELEGANGYILADAVIEKAKLTLYSAPIHIVATADIPCTTLSIDDKWLIDETGTEVRTNGCLDVIPDAFGRPSIDLGNEKSTLNINGGQLFVRNAYPESPNYISTLAIGYREYLKVKTALGMTVRVKLSGAGNDKGGGNVNFNDGTITCDSLTTEIMQEYGVHYRTPISMKCPVNTKINGGSFNCDVWACEGVVVDQNTGIPEGSSIGASPTNSAGDQLAPLKVPVISEAEAPYYLAKINFAQHPGGLINNVEGDANKGESLNAYYTRKDISYGHSSMKAVTATNEGDPDSVNLMLPYQYTGKQVYSDAYAHGWAYTIPHVKVTGDAPMDFGGPTSVKSDEENTTDYILYGILDEYITKIENYTTPNTLLGQVDVSLEFDTKYVEDVINAEEYQIEKAQYIVQPVRGDEWVLFSPPFDVTNVYVLEAYPETYLEELATTNRERAYELQAEANMDFFFQYCYQIVEMNTGDDFHYIYNAWKRDVSKLEKGAGLIKLEHFTGRNYNANYYLQRSSGIWEWDEANQKFTTDWKYLPADTVNDPYYDSNHTEHNVIMKKGEIYSLNFPYMYYGYQKEGKWDYWTGKYVIFEGLGTQTIEGTNYHETIRTINASSGKAAVLGNSTLATMTPSVDGYHLERDNKNGSQKFLGPYDEFDTEEISIEPTSGYVMVNAAPQNMPQRIKTVDMMSGEVTYEEGDGTATGTPTIAGNNKMLVYSIDGGVGIVPVVAQQVSVYNAAGQVVTSEYLTGETNIPLPAGIYLICGEHEQFKVLVK